MEPKEAAKEIRGLFKGIEYVPSYWRWHEATTRTTPAFTIWGMTKMYFWFLFFAPAELRKPLFGWSSFTAYKYILGSILDNNRASKRRKRSYIRDVFKAWNREWLPAESHEPNSRRLGAEIVAATSPHSELDKTRVSVPSTLP